MEPEELNERLKGPLTLEEVSRLTAFAVGFVKEHPTKENAAMAELILKAAGQSAQALKEFAEGYQVRGELHELSDGAARMIHERLRLVESLELCETCRSLVQKALEE